MGLRPLESDVYGRQTLTTEVDHRAVGGQALNTTIIVCNSFY